MPLSIKNQIIISDTSCLIGLSNIGLLEILKLLYETVLVTPEVAHEYGEALPEWILIKAAKNKEKIAAYNVFIDLGESSAIALAMETDNALLVLDDWKARKFAIGNGLKVTGTLGILIRAHNRGYINDLSNVISQLKDAGFHLPANIGELIH